MKRRKRKSYRKWRYALALQLIETKNYPKGTRIAGWKLPGNWHDFFEEGFSVEEVASCQLSYGSAEYNRIVGDSYVKEIILPGEDS